MTSEEHLHISDIHAFRERRLSGTKRSSATAHLLRCEECRNRLPKPTADEFWRAVMGDDEERIEATGIGSAWMSAKDWLSEAIFDRLAVRNTVFGSILLLAVLGFSLFLVMRPGGSPINNNLVAVAGNNVHEEIVYPTKAEGSGFDKSADTSGSSSASRRDVFETPQKNSDLPDQTRNGGNLVELNNGQLSRSVPKRQAKARGIPCGDQRFINLEAKHTGGGLQLKWDKVKGVLAYNLYISDLDEKLIAHFETSDQTSYLVKANLDEKTIYRFRLIATLESGERIVSESQNLKIENLKASPQTAGNLTVKKRTAATVRCLEVKQ
ncbi:MAG: fibronectin type III domain-containing protein [Pyrinomonadaceae bacterium]